MNRFAVFGSPIAHSLSPIIHQAFGKQCGISLSYEKILTPSGQLKAELKQFRANGGMGANITVPLKQEAYALCDNLIARAIEAKAVNTLYWQDDKLWGDNTDGEGLKRDLIQNLSLRLQDKRILILGAGGATLGILGPLLEEHPQAIVIVNRTLKKAKALCDRSFLISAHSYESLNTSNLAPFDIIINATSCSVHNMLPPLAARWIQGAFVMDLAYMKNQKTPFQQWATVNGATQSHDGLGMLVEQAAIGFALWHHKTPDTQDVLRKLRQGAL
ncbi:MAG: shikimate dehydrogenase [Gammaproteobacteria bacterium]|jgi:shikimate dehydrogenase|nr:shikimate dehydrogenase [Gammaproteobacteria bacterium]